MARERLDAIVLHKLQTQFRHPARPEPMEELPGQAQNPVNGDHCLVGKYNELADAYKSIYGPSFMPGAENECHVRVMPIPPRCWMRIRRSGRTIEGL